MSDDESKALTVRLLRATADRIEAGESIGVGLAVVNASGAGETLYSGLLGVPLIGTIEVLRQRMTADYIAVCAARGETER